jgi:hypothetical protein
LAALKVQGRHSRLPTVVTPERVQQLEQEVSEKMQALAELSIAYTLLEKKSVRVPDLGSRPTRPAGSAVSNGGLDHRRPCPGAV